mgnify:FL=1
MVRISVGSPTHHTSGRLYGVFFEDINMVRMAAERQHGEQLQF